MTAASTGVKIVAGPIEATAMGNAAVQLMTTGEIADLKAARAIIRNSFDTIEYTPENHEDWEAAYGKFKKVIEG